MRPPLLACVVPVLLALLWAVSGAEAASLAKRKRRSEVASWRQVEGAWRTSEGHVLHVTAERAYLNRGSADGLAAGEALQFHRRERRVGTCVVDRLSEHRASCPVGELREGDRFVLREARGGLDRPARPLAPTPRDELERRHQRLLAHPLALVEYSGEGQQAPPVRSGEVSLGHRTFAAGGVGRGPFQLEYVDVRIPGARVGERLRLSVSATAQRWSRLPQGARYPVGQPMELDVRTLELTSREPEQTWTLSVGRFWPYVAPGMGTLDGVQAGYVSPGGYELGLLAGAAPEPLTRMPSTERPIVGAYAGLTTSSAEGLVRWARLVGRAGVVYPRPGVARTELETAGRIRLGSPLELGGDVRLGLDDGRPEVLAARFDGEARVSSWLRAVAGFRTDSGVLYPENGWLEQEGLGRSTHMDAGLTFTAAHRLEVGLVSTFAWERESGFERALVGPELSHRGPSPVSWAVGYREELGWLRARIAHAQLGYTSAGGRVSLLGRLSVARDFSVGLQRRYTELGSYLHAQLGLGERLFLRAFVTGHTRRADGGAQTEDLRRVVLSGDFALGLKL